MKVDFHQKTFSTFQERSFVQHIFQKLRLGRGLAPASGKKWWQRWSKSARSWITDVLSQVGMMSVRCHQPNKTFFANMFFFLRRMRSHCLIWHSWRPRQVAAPKLHSDELLFWFILCDPLLLDTLLWHVVWIPYGFQFCYASKRFAQNGDDKMLQVDRDATLLPTKPTFVRLPLPWKDKKEPPVLVLLLVACR